MTLTVDTVLVPVDGTDASATAAEYAVTVADRYDANAHALYVLGETVTRAIETGDVAEDDVVEETNTFLGEVEDLAPEGVTVDSSIAYGFSTSRKLQHPGSVILDAAEDVDADFLVVPREGMRGDAGDVLEKAAEYVLLYASQPVLSV
ncbi:universal stress protein [Halobacterium jilantaiense]|uniref:Nucleotide-binding universal stress protein, UspA family n=1 Tax=Halobacterium jilantaiense TaxID=355548 RepID=A0A1I0PJ23_9EURY|nr:universal stress protein [Halobacterium jilantaiense]SEW13776.1 Nucleotide-binding universal stress protein, UspA family [Halobacterium jilantaiense]